MTSQERLIQIAAAARAGKLDEAAVAAAHALTMHREDAALNALAGAIELQRGQFSRAADLLEIAHSQFPQDLTIRTNLVEALLQSAAPERAAAFCTEALAKSDKSLRFTRLSAYAHQQASNFEAAIEFYKFVVERDPKDWSSWNNLGNCWAAYGDYPFAVAALERAIALAPESQPIRLNLGNILFEGGDPFRGEQVLKEAAEFDPSDPAPWRSLYDHYLDQSRDDDAYSAIEKASKLRPDDVVFQTEHGREAAKLNYYDLSDEAYRRALGLVPNFDPAFVGLASNLERTNNESKLQSLLDEAQTAGAHEATFDFIDALRLKRANRYEEALAALDRAAAVLPAAESPHMRGILLDRLGRFDEAFAVFEKMNQSNAEHASKPRERARSYVNLVSKASSLLDTEWPRSWTPDIAPDWRKTPVFLGSFPRSGTTLLDTMLMAGENTIVLEEQPFIARMQVEAGGVEALAKMTEDQLTEARESYWQRVSQHGEVTANTLVVDKQPLHTNQVAAIKRLFPDAKFILALRHPCDVLLSCYITNFRTNIAMANFLDLQDAANLYDQTFSHWEKARATFNIPVATVVYERLVEDSARELRPLFDWLGLAWPGDELDHRDVARARGVVNTASYAQVTEPIYKRAAGRWHSYSHHLEPIYDRLRPWVEKFGYSLDDGRIPDWPEPDSLAG